MEKRKKITEVIVMSNIIIYTAKASSAEGVFDFMYSHFGKRLTLRDNVLKAFGWSYVRPTEILKSSSYHMASM